jgi:hypothetical protein
MREYWYLSASNALGFVANQFVLRMFMHERMLKPALKQAQRYLHSRRQYRTLTAVKISASDFRMTVPTWLLPLRFADNQHLLAQTHYAGPDITCVYTAAIPIEICARMCEISGVIEILRGPPRDISNDSTTYDLCALSRKSNIPTSARCVYSNIGQNAGGFPYMRGYGWSKELRNEKTQNSQWFTRYAMIRV